MTRPASIRALVVTAVLGAVLGAVLAACGPTVRNSGDDDEVDPSAPCKPGRVASCYTGQDDTAGVGPCTKGTRTCSDQGIWSGCLGEVVPTAEACSDGVDNNCNGMVDEDVDADGDGFTTCGGDFCDSTECTQPELVNPGAFDAPGNNLDDDCDGIVDNGAAGCDQSLPNGTGQPMDYAKAIELCRQTTPAERRWGVLGAELTLANGSGTPATRSHAVRRRFGTGVTPRANSSLILLSTGAAAGRNDTNPSYQDFQNVQDPGNNTSSAFPPDFFAANGNRLPNAPGCPPPDPDVTTAQDPVMLTLTIRVPTNARSFKLQTNFFSSEFPEYTCSPFNDFFVVLLDSAYAGANPNPVDKNLAFYQKTGSVQKYPVGVNLASGDTGLFTQCVNGDTGCTAAAVDGTISTCTSTAQLASTGLDSPSSTKCNSNSLQGGGTGWLVTSGNVKPGEIIKLRIAIWDTSDHVLDSIAAIDAFEWSVELAQPGTVIF
jgi:hypothetical protein